MGLLSSFFQRKTPETSGAKPRGRQREAAAAAPTASDLVQQARVKARRRLIGATVLVGVGIIGFPVLFETQPRPVPVNIPIDVPARDGAPPLTVPAPRTGGGKVAAPAGAVVAEAPAEPAVITEKAEEQGREVPAPKAKVAEKAADKPADRPVEKVAEKPADKPAAKASAPAAKASAPAPRPPEPAASGTARFVVQAGSFTEAAQVKEARAKVEKLGFKTYTQQAQIDGSQRTRVRVGPFATRDEANQVVSKLKAAGITAAVLTL